jgi:hypothetical protein
LSNLAQAMAFERVMSTVCATRFDVCGVATGRFGLATGFGASTVMLGSRAAEPVAVCDTAVPLKLHSNEIDKIAIAEGAKRLDEDLMTLSSQIQDDYAVLVPYGTTHIQ